MKKILVALLVLSAAACGRGKAGSDGPQGPEGPAGDDPSSAPRVDSLSPAIGSRRNTVLVTGTNFSANPADLEVRFGGMLAAILEATPASLRVVPPIDLPSGPAPVTVTRGAKISASIAFTLTASGVDLDLPIGIVKRPGEPLPLADGRILVPDRDSASIVEIATTGVARTLVAGNGLVDPVRLAVRADGKVFVFDAQAPAIFRLDPATGALDVERFGKAYLGGSFDSNLDLYAVPASSSATGLDRIALNGALTEGWATYPATTAGIDVQVIGTTVYAAVQGAVPAVVKWDVATGGVATPHAAAGIDALRGLDAVGAELLVAGSFTLTNGEGVALLDSTTGAVAPVTTDATPFTTLAGAYREQGGAYVIADGAGRWVARFTGTALDVLSGIGGGIDHLVPAGAATWAVVENGPGKPGWISELPADGTSRVVARGRFGQIAPATDPAKLVVTRLDSDDVAEIVIATGATASAFSVAAEMSEPVGYARDSAGFQYVSSATDGLLRKYDAAGVVVAGFTPAFTGVSHLRVDGAYVYATSPATGALLRVYLVDGGISFVFEGSAGVVAPTTTFRDSSPQGDSFLYLTDPVGGWLYFVDGDAHGSVSPHVPIAAGAIQQRADGMLVAGGSFGLRLITP